MASTAMSSESPETPASLGYRFPAEWEPHRATWLAWPHNPNTWPGKFEPIPAMFRQFVAAVAPHEQVHILAGRSDVMTAARQGRHIPNVTLHDIPTNDCWIRDFGPLFLVGDRGQPPAMVDFRYNAWGGKYPPFEDDDRATARINEVLELRRFEVPIILEGGSIDVNGKGTVLTTEACLLNPNRNPQLSRKEIEQYLADYLAANACRSGSRATSPATTPTGTSTSLPASWTKGPSSPRSRRSNRRELSCRCATTFDASKGDRPRWPPAHRRSAPHAATEVSRQPAFARQLCEFLYRQRRSSIVPAFDDPADEVAAATLCAGSSHRGESNRSRPSTWSGASAPSIA